MISLFKTASAFPSITHGFSRPASRVWNSSKPGGNSSNLGKVALVLVPAGLGAGYYFSSQSTPQSITSKKLSENLPINPNEFTPFTLKDVQTVTHDTSLYRFAIPDNQALQLPITSCIVTRKPPKEGEKPVIRPYTPVSSEDQVGYFDLVIKHYDTGAFTSYIKTMKPGETLEFKGPFLKYLYKANTLREVSLIAGGTGITPMLQLVRKIFSDPKDTTRVNLVFANRTEKDILLKDELDAYAKAHPDRFKVHYLLDTPPKAWTGGKGFITSDVLKEHIHPSAKGDAMVFVCGPPPMMKAISGEKKSPQDQGELSGMLLELGFIKDNIFKF